MMDKPLAHDTTRAAILKWQIMSVERSIKEAGNKQKSVINF